VCHQWPTVRARIRTSARNHVQGFVQGLGKRSWQQWAIFNAVGSRGRLRLHRRCLRLRACPDPWLLTASAVSSRPAEPEPVESLTANARGSVRLSR